MFFSIRSVYIYNCTLGNHVRYRTVILVMLLISSLVSITGSAANTVRTDIDERLLVEYPVDYFDLELDLPVTEYICGYSLDRQTRGL